eukprot:s174_g5.t1
MSLEDAEGGPTALDADAPADPKASAEAVRQQAELNAGRARLHKEAQRVASTVPAKSKARSLAPGALAKSQVKPSAPVQEAVVVEVPAPSGPPPGWSPPQAPFPATA